MKTSKIGFHMLMLWAHVPCPPWRMPLIRRSTVHWPPNRPGSKRGFSCIWAPKSPDIRRDRGDFGEIQVLAKSGEHVLVNHDSQRVLNDADGRQVGEVELPATPNHVGLAVAGGRVVVTCSDGSVVCFE